MTFKNEWQLRMTALRWHVLDGLWEKVGEAWSLCCEFSSFFCLFFLEGG